MKTAKANVFLGMGVLLLGMGAGGCQSVEEKNRQAEATAEVVLRLLAAEEADPLYDHYTTEEFQRLNDRKTLRKLARAIRLQLGAPEKRDRLEYRLHLREGTADGEYLWRVQWAKAEGTLHLGLTWRYGSWKIRTLDIRSPAIDAARKTRSSPAGAGEVIHI